MTITDAELLYLVVFSIKLRDEGDERESHDGHQ